MMQETLKQKVNFEIIIFELLKRHRKPFSKKIKNRILQIKKYHYWALFPFLLFFFFKFWLTSKTKRTKKIYFFLKLLEPKNKLFLI